MGGLFEDIGDAMPPPENLFALLIIVTLVATFLAGRYA